jgi:uncharacterized protein
MRAPLRLTCNENASDIEEKAMPGKFFWYELMTTDPKAASAFYGEVIGWTSQSAGDGSMDYTLLSMNGQNVAGLMALPEAAIQQGGKPAWLGYIAVEDVDDAAAKLQGEGGTVHRPPETIPGIIRFAVVSDPQGAVFFIAKGLMENAAPELPPGTSGTVGWRELLAADWQAAFSFYEKMFGWTKAETIDMGPMGMYQLFATGEAGAGGMMTKPETVPRPFWIYYFNVPTLDATLVRVNSAGGRVIMGPTEVPGGHWIAQCVDPQGAYFALVAPQR